MLSGTSMLTEKKNFKISKKNVKIKEITKGFMPVETVKINVM